MGQRKSKFSESAYSLGQHAEQRSQASTINSVGSIPYRQCQKPSKSQSYLNSGVSNDSGCFSDRQDCHTATNSLKSSKSPIDCKSSRDGNKPLLTFNFHELFAAEKKVQNKRADKLLKEINQILSKQLAHLNRIVPAESPVNREYSKKTNLRRTLSEKNLKISHKVKRERSVSKIDDLRCKMGDTLKRSCSKSKVFNTKQSDENKPCAMEFPAETHLAHLGRYRTSSRRTVCKNSSIRFDDDKFGFRRGLEQAIATGTAAEKLTNQIAAKLLSESIDLAKKPYTDEMGFCKIPRALVKRYACELRRSIDAVGQCIENERLDQLKKLGKLGIPNDFHLTRLCLCAKNLVSEKADRSLWSLCQCDIDTTSYESFFYKLGFPMYVDTRGNRVRVPDVDQLKHLLDMNRADIEFELKIRNKNHLYVVCAAVQTARSMTLND